MVQDLSNFVPEEFIKYQPINVTTMLKLIKAGMIAIALTATTAVMAQTVDGTTQATKKEKTENKAEAPESKNHKFTCPKCGAEIDMPKHSKGNRHGRREGRKAWRHRGANPDSAATPQAMPEFHGHPGMMPGFPGGPGAMPDTTKCPQMKHGHHGMQHPGFPVNPENQPKFEVPEVGSIHDSLPQGAMAIVKDGKQIFNVFGVEYEPVVEKKVIKYKVISKPEKK